MGTHTLTCNRCSQVNQHLYMLSQLVLGRKPLDYTCNVFFHDLMISSVCFLFFLTACLMLLYLTDTFITIHLLGHRIKQSRNVRQLCFNLIFLHYSYGTKQKDHRKNKFTFTYLPWQINCTVYPDVKVIHLYHSGEGTRLPLLLLQNCRLTGACIHLYLPPNDKRKYYIILTL